MDNKISSDDQIMQVKAVHWACQSLELLGFKLKSTVPTLVLNPPWSYVSLFDTTSGYIYLKQTPKDLSLESKITTLLRNEFHSQVPDIVAVNDELNCFLMKDAGVSLRGILKKRFDVELLCRAINIFTSMQLDISLNTQSLLALGVPDWNVEIFHNLLAALLNEEELLIADGLTLYELNCAKKQVKTVAERCEALSRYAIKPTLVQCDFHDNNLLVKGESKDITIIDLGEIVVSHPFFSTVGCLMQMEKHYAMKKDDELYTKIKSACFANYVSAYSAEIVNEAFETAESLWLVYWILCQYRLMNACGREKIMAFQKGRLSNALRELTFRSRI